MPHVRVPSRRDLLAPPSPDRAQVGDELPAVVHRQERRFGHSFDDLGGVAGPVAVINEAARVLVPGGCAVWSHTDFDTVVVNTEDVELSRWVLHGYAHQTQPWMEHSDARLGRKLVGIVARSHLQLDDPDTNVVVESDRVPLAEDRIDDIAAALAGNPSLARDVVRWRRQVDDALAADSFLFAETTFVLTTRATARAVAKLRPARWK